MLKRLLFIGLVIMLMSGTGCLDIFWGGIRGSGVEATVKREVGHFDAVKLTGSPDVDIRISEPRSLSLTADDNILDLIETEVRDNTLFIGSKKSYSSRTGVEISIVVPELRGAWVTGSGDITVHGLDSPALETGVSGSGDISASGTVGEVDAVVTGSGSIDLSEVMAKQAEAMVTGSGDIEIYAEESLDATVTGSGDISYRGSPEKVNRKVTGSGSVKGS